MRSVTAWSVVLAVVCAPATLALAGPDDDIEKEMKTVNMLRETGQIEPASAAVTSLLAKHPDSLDLHILHQDLELALGHDKDLIAAYRAAAALPEATADTHYLCGRVLRAGAAVTEFRAALKLDPAHFWAACNLGMELTRSKSWTEARAILEDAAKRNPESAVPVNALGRLEEARAKYAEAEKYYRAALALDGKLTVTRVNLGLALIAQGKNEPGIAELKAAALDSSKDPMPLIALGMAYRDMKDEKSAIESFKRAADADEGDIAALNLVAMSYLAFDQTDHAELVLQRAISAAPTSLITKANLAFVRLEKSQYEEAVTLASEAVAGDDSMAQAHYVLALAYDHLVQPKKADPEYRKATKLDDDNPDYARASAAFAGSQGDWGRAISEYVRAVKLSGNSPDVMMELAGAYSGGKKAGAAASTYDQVVAADPTRTEAWLQLGIVCARDLKEYKRASKALHAYIDRGGKDPRVPGWIVRLDAM